MNACGNTVQENRHRLAVPKHERLQTPIDARVIERLRQSTNCVCQVTDEVLNTRLVGM